MQLNLFTRFLDFFKIKKSPLENNFSIDFVKYTILTDALEDIKGLYEIIWTLNEKFAEVSKDEKVEISKLAMIDLLEDCYVELHIKNWKKLTEKILDLDESLKVIKINSAWEEPDTGGNYYCFTSTKKTKRELRKQYRRIKKSDKSKN